MNVIAPVTHSEWAAPIVCVRKSNGKLRVCADFSTGLNKALESFDYPLPVPEDIFATLNGGAVFSQIDLSDAYLQIELSDESKKMVTIDDLKTAVIDAWEGVEDDNLENLGPQFPALQEALFTTPARRMRNDERVSWKEWKHVDPHNVEYSILCKLIRRKVKDDIEQHNHIHGSKVPPPALPRKNESPPEVLISKVRSATGKLDSGKASGKDGTTVEMLKAGALWRELARMFSRYLELKRIPNAWKESKMILLYKKVGRTSSKTIDLFAFFRRYMYKVFTKIPTKRLTVVSDEEQPRE
ncbi:hypothetical protein ANCCEY_04090 [Ancylostoma ceylanicum]|uniref:Reverse transcriptase domain-containing protein n=1 Tax=Ancylostoma ceylanicum TaxID=53326 RepID=A0A0D6M032_9BILA|nr:hypothetical protein ANCCEY_04090 [Ancylostoma ceylanicum]